MVGVGVGMPIIDKSVGVNGVIGDRLLSTGIGIGPQFNAGSG